MPRGIPKNRISEKQYVELKAKLDESENYITTLVKENQDIKKEMSELKSEGRAMVPIATLKEPYTPLTGHMVRLKIGTILLEISEEE